MVLLFHITVNNKVLKLLNEIFFHTHCQTSLSKRFLSNIQVSIFGRILLGVAVFVPLSKPGVLVDPLPEICATQ